MPRETATESEEKGRAQTPVKPGATNDARLA